MLGLGWDNNVGGRNLGKLRRRDKRWGIGDRTGAFLVMIMQLMVEAEDGKTEGKLAGGGL